MMPVKKTAAKSRAIWLGSACTKGQAGHSTTGQPKAEHWQASHSSKGQARGSVGDGADQNVFSVDTSEATTPAINADCDIDGAISFTKKA